MCWNPRIRGNGTSTPPFETVRFALRGTMTLTMKPSEYFYRQCLISMDPDAGMTAEVVRHIGADYVTWASDYPHIDASYGVVAEMRESVALLPLDAQAKVLGENVSRFYGLTAAIPLQAVQPSGRR